MMSMPEPMRLPSDESEGPVLRNFVNNALGVRSPNDSDETSPSPRSEPVSSESNRDDDRRTRRAPTSRHHRERELRRTVETMFKRLEAETLRANEAERARAELVGQFRTLNESRVKALQEAAKANEELRLYQLQYHNAQAEIKRAQAALIDLRDQRDDAEKSAIRARKVARELSHQRLVAEAKEQGRRLGFKAGFEQAQVELGLLPEGDIDNALLGMQARRDSIPPEDDYYSDDREDDAPWDDRRASQERPRITDGGQSTYSMPEHEEPSLSMPEAVTQPVPHPAPRSQSPAIPIQDFTLPIPSADHFTTPGNRVRQDLPPDNYIPPTDGDGFIPIPPPHGFSNFPDHSHMATPSPGSRSVTLPQIPPPELVHDPSMRSKDFAYGTSGSAASLGRGPPPSDLPNPHARTASGPSRRHSGGSASTSSHISQIGLVRDPADHDRAPSGRPRAERELSVIKEDITGSARDSPQAYRKPSMGMMSQASHGRTQSVTGGDSFFEGSGGVSRQREAQQLADNLRYDNVSAVQQWRRQGAADSRPPSRDHPPRHVRMPSKLTVPAPLSPPNVETGRSSRGHQRSISEMSAASNSKRRDRAVSITSMSSSLRRGNDSVRGGPSQGGSEYLSMPAEQQRRAATPGSGSADINVNVESPSAPSDSQLVGGSVRETPNFLSPRHATGRLPGSPSMKQRNPPLVPTVPNTPVSVAQPLQWPTGPEPVIPQFRDMQPKYHHDAAVSEANSRPSSRNGTHPNDPMLNRSPSQFYVEPFTTQSPFRPPNDLPSRGVSPRPPSEYGRPVPPPQNALPVQMRPSQSQMSLGGGSRPGSVRSFFSRHNKDASGSPMPAEQSLPPEGIPGQGPWLQRVKSNASIASSYRSYDPNKYLDPAFYGPEPSAAGGARSQGGGVAPSGGPSKSKHSRSRTVSTTSGLEYY